MLFATTLNTRSPCANIPSVPSYSKNEDVLTDFISMGQPIYLFVALVVGLFVGAGTIWLILRALSIRLTEFYL